MPRRGFLLAVLTAALLLVGVDAPAQAHPVLPRTAPSTTDALPADSPAIPASLADLQRGLEAQKALDTYFARGRNYYLETYPAGRSDSFMAWLWSYTQAMAANETLDSLLGGVEGNIAHQDVENWLAGLSNYRTDGAYNASVRPPVGIIANTYYDDNDWTGLDLIAAYDATGDTNALNQAETMFNNYITRGWAYGAPCGGLTGGIYWVSTGGQAFQDRTTTATAGAALLALELYAHTRNPAYLNWGQRMYNWVNQYLRDPSDGLYWDHISPGPYGCVIDKDKVTYNQGVMIAATFLLGQLLPINSPNMHSYALQQIAYTVRAEQLAQATLNHYNGQYDGQPAPFNGILFQTLGQLFPYAGNDPQLQNDIIQAMRSYSAWAYAHIRDARTGLYWFPHPEGAVFLLDQGAMVQIYATLAMCEQMQSTQCVMNMGCGAVA